VRLLWATTGKHTHSRATVSGSRCCSWATWDGCRTQGPVDACVCECMCVCGSYLKQCSQCTLQAVVGCRRAVREQQQRTRKRRPLASSTACLMFWYVVRCPRFRITS
jgi:hypothetical protein